MPTNRDEQHLLYRVEVLESAVETIADTSREALDEQREFNTRVEVFMASIRVWGVVALLIYGTGQAFLVAALTGHT